MFALNSSSVGDCIAPASSQTAAANISPSVTDPQEAVVSPRDPMFVHDGDWVVLEASDGKRVLGRIIPDATARIAKRKRKIYGICGCRWGDLFTVAADDSLQRVGGGDRGDDGAGQQISTGNFGISGKDNRNLRDDDKNQVLSHDAIEALKAKGVTGRDMVRSVVKNSTTFKAKTTFAQDKYVKRKLQKYNVRVRVVRPTALSICETYFSKAPDKIMGMRPDALGLLLGFSGVRAGCRALVYENCTGVLTAAVAERMGGHGQLLNVFTQSSPVGFEILKMMNTSETVWDSVLQTPVEIFGKLNIREDADEGHMRYLKEEREDIAEDVDEDAEKHQASERRRSMLSQRPRRGELKQLIREQVDALVVAARNDIVAVMDVLLRHVAPSGTFAVYSPYLQPLAELQLALQLGKLAVRVEVMETNLVVHQVLPGRTHPMMSDSGTGGYVLWGVRISVGDSSSTCP